MAALKAAWAKTIRDDELSPPNSFVQSVTPKSGMSSYEVSAYSKVKNLAPRRTVKRRSSFKLMAIVLFSGQELQRLYIWSSPVKSMAEDKEVKTEDGEQYFRMGWLRFVFAQRT
jgi:hypothetical protein